MNWRIGISLSVLLINTITDVRRREISLPITLSYCAIGIIWWIYSLRTGQADSWVIWIGSLAPGVLLCMLSWLSHGNVGFGDGMITFGLGVWNGPDFTVKVLMIALFAASIYAGYLILFQKAGRRKQIPFLPFLFLGTIGGFFL